MKYKLGDIVYRYVVGLFKYEIIAIRQNQEGQSLELRALNCTHGWQCEILVAPNDDGLLQYVCMLNNKDGEGQSHWHKVEGQFFHLTQKAALKNKCDHIIQLNREFIADYKRKIELCEAKIETASNFGGDLAEFKKEFCI